MYGLLLIRLPAWITSWTTLGRLDRRRRGAVGLEDGRAARSRSARAAARRARARAAASVTAMSSGFSSSGSTSGSGTSGPAGGATGASSPGGSACTTCGRERERGVRGGLRRTRRCRALVPRSSPSPSSRVRRTRGRRVRRSGSVLSLGASIADASAGTARSRIRRWRADELIAEVAERARETGVLGIDTEFMSEGRYRPLLCLIQLAVPNGDESRVELIDPFEQPGRRAARRGARGPRRSRSSCTPPARTSRSSAGRSTPRSAACSTRSSRPASRGCRPASATARCSSGSSA